MNVFHVLVVGALLATAPAVRPSSVGDGYWHASGNKILDAAGNEVRFSGVNFSGFESTNYALHGTWGGIGRNWKTYLDQIKSLGFNLIRLPFSGDIFTPGRMPQNVDYSVNSDLQGKSTMEFLDLFVSECGLRGIRIILDYHRIQAGATPENGLWYLPGSGIYTEQYWINNWKALVGRYVGNPTVVGCDLFNEVHADGSHPGPYWAGDGSYEPYNWRTAAKRCAEAILSVNPNLLICLQGMDHYGPATSWWGANHEGLKDFAFDISRPAQAVYEVHDYGPNVWNQAWHNAPDFPSNLPAFWDGQWGFVHNENLGPIWIGEWGSKLDVTKEIQWATTFRDYVKSKGLIWTWWTWGPNSGDTGGILRDDWTTVNQNKLDLIASVMYPGFQASGAGGGSGGGGGGSSGGAGTGGGGGHHCGAAGAEAMLAFALAALLRRCRAGRRSPGRTSKKNPKG